jgi:hypothetical protein
MAVAMESLHNKAKNQKNAMVSQLKSDKAFSIGLVETPALRLIDPDGKNWTGEIQGTALVSKQILLSNLQAGGFDAQLVNLRIGQEEEEYGSISWKNRPLSKVLRGTKISEVDPQAYDAWGVTCNFTQDREATCLTIQHLAKGNRPIVVGGSDALAVPEPYFQAGATAVVQDKSGAANWAIFDSVLGRTPREELTGVLFADGKRYRKKIHPLSPQDWPLPATEVSRQCLGVKYPTSMTDERMLPIGSVLLDIGCDRTCDFCQTPTYKLGYRRMLPEKALQWFATQKAAGARSVVCGSDQFLGRVLFGEEGRQEIIEIVRGIRELGLAVLWSNGVELKKATLGHGIRPDGDPTPDEELVQAVWGWDREKRVGCLESLIPAERPVFGTEAYTKLLPWKHHRAILRSIVRAGVPHIMYGVIIGLPNDSHESLLQLEEALLELHQELIALNPELDFVIRAFSIAPLPGTPQEQNIRQLGLLRFDDPTIIGGFWTTCADTHHLSYEEISDWQVRIGQIGSGNKF